MSAIGGASAFRSLQYIGAKPADVSEVVDSTFWTAAEAIPANIVVDSAIGIKYAQRRAAAAIVTAAAASEAYTDGEISTLSGTLTTAIATAKSEAITAAEGYTDSEISTLSGTLTTAIATAKSEAIADAATYTDGEISTLSSTLTTAIATAKGEAITAAEGYTDSEISTLSGTLTTAIATAKSEAIDAAAAASESYTDSAVSTLSGTLTTAIATAKSEAIADAATYTDGEISTLSSTLTTAIATAKGEAIADAATYTDGEITTLHQYVDDRLMGLAVKEGVRVATQSNIASPVWSSDTGVTNGIFSGVGAGTSVNGVVDGVTLAVGDRVLIKAQTNAAQNGVYVYQLNANNVDYDFVRAEDLNGLGSASEIVNGTFVFVAEGTDAGKGFAVTLEKTGSGNTEYVLNTDDQNWTQVSAAVAYTAGNGISVASHVVSVSLAADKGLEFSGTDLAAKIDETLGLYYESGAIAVNAGAGLQYAGGAVAVKYNAAQFTINGSSELEIISQPAGAAAYAIDTLADSDSIDLTKEVHEAAPVAGDITGTLNATIGAIAVGRKHTFYNTAAAGGDLFKVEFSDYMDNALFDATGASTDGASPYNKLVLAPGESVTVMFFGGSKGWRVEGAGASLISEIA